MLRRALLVIGVAAALLVLAAPVAVAYEPPPILESFSPSGVVPGDWTLDAPIQPLEYASTCAGQIRRWARPDGVRFAFSWVRCDEDDLHSLLVDDAVARMQQGAAERDRSVLPDHADLVVAREGSVLRGWIQDSYQLGLGARCQELSTDDCAAMTASAARVVSAALPGEPRVTDAALLAGPEKLIIGLFTGCGCMWAMLVGARMGQIAMSQPRLSGNPYERRLVRIDGLAQELRRAARLHRLGQALVAVAALAALFAVLAVLRRSIVAVACTAVVAILLAVPGFVLMYQSRHPLLVAPWLRQRVRLGVPRRQRLASAAVTGALTAFAIAVPLLAIIGFVGLGLSRSGHELGRVLLGFLAAAAAIGYFVDILARRLRARDIGESRKIDERPPIIYLRNFADDGQKVANSALTRQGLWQVMTAWIDPIRRTRFEELLVRGLWRYGPVYALSDPKARLATLGAAKTKMPADTEEWKDFVEDWAQRARAVVVSATPAQLNQGLRWELKLLAERLAHGRIVLVLGPWEQKHLPYYFQAFLAEIERFPLFWPLTRSWVTEDTHVLVHVPSQGRGTWYGWSAGRRTPWSYAAAIDAAMAWVQPHWDRPPAELHLLGTDRVTSTVTSAATHAATAGDQRPVDTRSLLLALMHADGSGRWDRIALDAADPNGAGRDRVVAPAGDWHGAPFTGSAARAMRIATQVSYRYNLGPVPPGALALGLVADPDSAASKALGVTSAEDHEALIARVQDDLLGVTLDGADLRGDGPGPAHDGARIGFGAADTEPPPPPVRPPPATAAPASSTPTRLRPKTVVYAALVIGFFNWGGAAIILDNPDDPGAVIGAGFLALVLQPVLLYAVAHATLRPRYARKLIVIGVLISIVTVATVVTVVLGINR